VDTEVLITITNRRRSLYGFLSRIFLQEVSEEFLQEIFFQPGMPPAIPPDEAKGDFEKGFALFRKAVDQLRLEKDMGEAVTLLRREFVYTFIVQGSHPVSPYESVYLGEERLLMQKPYDEVRTMFKEAGITPTKDCKELEDHIAMELEFMSILCQKSIQNWKDGEWDEALASNHLQRRFLREHLIKWVPQFCEDVTIKTRMDFYRGIAYMTRGFVILDSEEVEKLAQALEDSLRERR